VLGEVNAQYMGIAPNDTRLAAYFALAEELDVPVGLHLGTAPPGVAYAASPFPPRKSPKFRGEAGRPMLLEDVLVAHPKARVYVMHAAWPFLDEMTYMLAMHPQLYVDVSVLQYAIPRPAYHRYLRQLVEAGFGKRIMFGSDGSGRRLREGVAAIMEADFLTAAEKRDILYDNAARFFRLPPPR
jgi:predicted TIM-barrel fold metal-dependent hydrolase